MHAHGDGSCLSSLPVREESVTDYARGSGSQQWHWTQSKAKVAEEVIMVDPRKS